MLRFSSLINTLSLMEARRQNVLNFTLQAAFTVLSILTNGNKNYDLPRMCEVCLKYEQSTAQELFNS